MFEFLRHSHVTPVILAALLSSQCLSPALAQEASPAKPEKTQEFWKPSDEITSAERERARKLEASEGQDAVPDDATGIAPLLAKHPDSSVIICVAGCGPQPTIVEVVSNAEILNLSDVGEMQQNSTETAAGLQPAAGAVVCVAGCNGKRGEVIFKSTRLSWLGDQNSEKTKARLRAIADRLAANEQPPAAPQGNRFVTPLARAALVGEPAVANAVLPRGTLD